MTCCSYAGRSKLAIKGRYGHVAGAVLNDTLLITGGYRGSVLGDLIALKLPLSITAASVVHSPLVLTVLIGTLTVDAAVTTGCLKGKGMVLDIMPLNDVQ